MLFLKHLILVTTLLCFSTLQASSVNTGKNDLIFAEKNALQPWFTGPLIAASGHTVPAHHIVLEPYIFVTDVLGQYDNNWKSISIPNIIIVDPVVFFKYGITDVVEIKIVTDLHSNFRQHSHDTRMGNFQFGFGFQALEDNLNSWRPDFRIEIKEDFPTGHYQHLNPDKHGTDITGTGLYRTGISLNFQKLFIIDSHLLRVRWNFDYYASPPVHVEGFNAYGGGYGTSGKVKVGDRFFSVLAFEYTFTQHWIGALDIVYDMNNRISFSGNSGFTRDGIPATMGAPARKQFSLAPAIEYAFNNNLGIIFGPWFSIAGKNSSRFVSGVIALNYYH